MRNLLSNSLKVCVFLLSVFLSAQTFAQVHVAESVLNCTPAQAHCTSNDLQIVGAFVDAPACATCGTGNQVTYPLKMTIHNGTKSVRTAFALYGNLSTGAKIIFDNVEYTGKIVICVGPITVKSSETLPGESAPGNQTFAVGSISFSCGQSLSFSDNILAWTDAAGTTDDRCATFIAADECSDVEPKCGEAGSIIIRQPLSFSTTDVATCTTGQPSNDGKLIATPLGGKADFTFTLSGNTQSYTVTDGHSATFTGLTAGTYTVTCVDANSCTATATATVGGKSCCVPPTLPAFTITEPTVSLCSSNHTDGSITICNSQTGYTYKVSNVTKAGTTNTSLTFSGLAAGSNPKLTVSDGSFSGCSSEFSCTQAATVCPGSITRAASSTTEINIGSETTVKAYPNPFSDKVKFLVTSDLAGRGSLEVYNMMGQRVKTVYQGLFVAGQQTFELSMPRQQISNLIYVLRVGNKKTSGKLLQINQ